MPKYTAANQDINERPEKLSAAVHALSQHGSLEERGAVFTRIEVVQTLLDLCGYTADRPLHRMRFLEPSFGDGEFLIEAIRRLLSAFEKAGGTADKALEELAGAVRGVELHADTFAETMKRVHNELTAHGLPQGVAKRLCATWLICDDFLLASLPASFDVIVGNPPYVRQERIPAPLLEEYKSQYKTLYDRADLYILFFEKSLDLLSEDGMLGFICADRWLKNKYGGPLRSKVDEDFRLRFFIDLKYADAFHSDVDAYPAITVLQRAKVNQSTVVGIGDSIKGTELKDLQAALFEVSAGGESQLAMRLERVSNGRDPWLLDSPHVLPVLRRIEKNFPRLEEAGSRVTIGVATGADKIFIGDYEDLPVETSRKLRLALHRDCGVEGVAWGGMGVVNPYEADGALADLEQYPHFAQYLRKHEARLRKRHVAKKNPARWYKTIDRIHLDLLTKPKLLIPDIKGDATVTYDDGKYYPHHNLYVITSDIWDLHALQAVLRSSVALMFIASYCVKMSGGFLRFQAQYLRRIRVPHRESLSPADVTALRNVSKSPDIGLVDDVVLPLFNLSESERQIVRDFANAARVGK